MTNKIKLLFKLQLIFAIFISFACVPALTNNQNNNTNIALIFGFLFLSEQSSVAVPACGSLNLSDSANTISASKAATYSTISLVFIENSFTLPLFSVYRPVGCKPASHKTTITSTSSLSGVYSYDDPNAPSFPSKYVETSITSGTTRVITNELAYNAKRYITRYSQTCGNTAVSGSTVTTYTYDTDNRLTKTTVVTPASCNSAGTPTAERTITTDFNYLTTSADLSSQVTTTVIGSSTTINTITYSDYVYSGAKFASRKSTTTNTTNGVAGTSSSATEAQTFDSQSRLLEYKSTTTTNGASYPITSTIYVYNTSGKVSSLAFKNETSASASTTSTLTYTYDGSNRMTGWTSATQTVTASSTTTAAGNFSTYTYKANGELDTNNFQATSLATATFSN